VVTLLRQCWHLQPRGRERLGVETGVNEGDGAPGVEMEGIPLLL